jgi:hypothetical protein
MDAAPGGAPDVNVVPPSGRRRWHSCACRGGRPAAPNATMETDMKKLLVALVAALAAHAAGAAGEADPPPGPPVKGEVLEVLDTDSFTYMRLKTAKGETWAAVGKAPVKKGEQVTITNPTVMQNFQSKALKRTFDTIVIGRLSGSPGTPAPAMSAGAPGAAADLAQFHGGTAKSPNVEIGKVAKAEGANGRTVAEVHANRAALKDKPVAVRARVVKVTPGVMGKNWVHLRDGSGSAADGSNDLLVTSKDEPGVGDLVLARGTVKTDVNLGSGYAYKVLVEDASIRK